MQVFFLALAVAAGVSAQPADLLGTWQAVMLVELDGPRDRRIVVTTLPSAA